MTEVPHCRRKSCHGVVIMKKVKKHHEYRCSKCNREYYVYRLKVINQRPQI